MASRHTSESTIRVDKVEYQRLNDRLKRKNDCLAYAHKRSNELCEEVTGLNTQLTGVKAELNTTQTKLAECNIQCEKVEKKLEVIELKLEKSELKFEKSEAKCEKFEKKCAEYQDKCADFEEKCADFQEKCADFEKGNEDKDKTIQCLKEMVVQLRANADLFEESDGEWSITDPVITSTPRNQFTNSPRIHVAEFFKKKGIEFHPS